jgi:hypothetical protein
MLRTVPRRVHECIRRSKLTLRMRAIRGLMVQDWMPLSRLRRVVEVHAPARIRMVGDAEEWELVTRVGGRSHTRRCGMREWSDAY